MEKKEIHSEKKNSFQMRQSSYDDSFNYRASLIDMFNVKNTKPMLKRSAYIYAYQTKSKFLLNYVNNFKT